TSSTKGLTGHTLGAAGAIEGVLSLIALSSGFVPATAGLEEPPPEIRVRHVPAGGLARHFSVVVSNSFWFGGNNTAPVLSPAPSWSSPELRHDARGAEPRRGGRACGGPGSQGESAPTSGTPGARRSARGPRGAEGPPLARTGVRHRLRRADCDGGISPERRVA